MVSVSQLREVVRQYLSGSLELQNFADRFEEQYSEIALGRDLQALALADEIAAYIGRVSSGFWSESELKESLFPLSFDLSLSANVLLGSAQMFPLSVNQQLVGKAFQEEAGSSDTSPAVVFGLPQLLRA